MSSKSKVPSSVLPWKTKWKPSPEDRKNWNRFLSTNSEEMSKSMQFSFNDLKLRGFAGHTATVRTIAVNEPAKLFASGSRDRTVKLWSLNVHDGIENWETTPYSECVVTYTGHRRGTINDVHFLTGIGSGLSDVVASCDGHVHLWNLETGKNIHQFTSSRPSVITVKPIFHNQNLVGGTLEGNLTFFDTHNHRLLHTWKSNANLTGSIRVIAVNQAETLIAVSFSTGAISLVESRTGTLVASWKGGDTEITMMKFYTDELLVSCAPADHLICCWNVNHLALVKTMTATQDVISLDLFKDEILTINNSNSVSFIPVNDELQSYSSKFKSSIIKSQVSAFAIVPTEPSLLFGCTEGEIFLYA
ncbi:WD40-repeat-containing domain protein [Circinella umbellata]|nr:WD40-repeat-containing domain protein [Circinella umbellata]